MMDDAFQLAPFANPLTTAKGEQRASVSWNGLSTLWLNTGTLCNIECANCYIESSPKNDRLVYLKHSDVVPFLDEIDALNQGAKEIGITGGEPFMCPDILLIMEDILKRGHKLLLLTNAMQPMMRARIRDGLLDLKSRFNTQMILRVSMDHHSADLHDEERGAGAYAHAIKGLSWLAEHNVDPNDMMCASQRMVVRKKGAKAATVMPCTLLAYDDRFEMGQTLAEATRDPVHLNHRWCAEFCVLGGGSCSA